MDARILKSPEVSPHPQTRRSPRSFLKIHAAVFACDLGIISTSLSAGRLMFTANLTGKTSALNWCAYDNLSG
jgi:hypothetical protein